MENIIKVLVRPQGTITDRVVSSAAESHLGPKRLPHIVAILQPQFTQFSSTYVQAQQSLVMASYVELGMPMFDSLFVARAAAHDLARQALFQPFQNSPI